jgi:hypothetical protein
MSYSGAQRFLAVKAPIQRGDLAPWWNQGPDFAAFDPVGGRFVVMVFCGSMPDPASDDNLQKLSAQARLADSEKMAFFVVCANARNENALKAERELAPLRFLWDRSEIITSAYGFWRSRSIVVLNPMLRVAQVLPFDACEGALFDYLDSLPPASQYLGFEAPPPILVLSDVFEPELCASLIRHFDQIGGKKSGFMQELSGKPVEVVDPEWKRRRDHMINDLSLIGEIRRRIARRVAPEMQKAFHFKTTRTERDLIACYRAEDRDHFGAHRDDVTAATAHRQFAVSVNLNDDFEGGEAGFPEFGARRYKGPAGAAMIYSCSMLHDVSKVTKGRRFAYLTFLFDEAGEQTRLAASGKML